MELYHRHKRFRRWYRVARPNLRCLGRRHRRRLIILESVIVPATVSATPDRPMSFVSRGHCSRKSAPSPMSRNMFFILVILRLISYKTVLENQARQYSPSSARFPLLCPARCCSRFREGTRSHGGGDRHVSTARPHAPGARGGGRADQGRGWHPSLPGKAWVDGISPSYPNRSFFFLGLSCVAGVIARAWARQCYSRRFFVVVSRGALVRPIASRHR